MRARISSGGFRRDLGVPGGAGAGATRTGTSDDLFGSTLGGSTTLRAGELDAVREQPPSPPPTAAPDPVLVPDEAWGRLRAGLVELVLGLSALHASGRVHRDVKPANVLVSVGDRVTLLDFGLVAALREEGEDGRPREIVGTPAYMAPEQLLPGPITGAADLYAVGAVLYEALTGALPFEGHTTDMLRKKRRFVPRDARALAPAAPADLAALAMDLLAIDPARRPGAERCLERLAPGSAAALAGRASAPEAPFVGRARETAAIEQALAEVVEHGRQIVMHVHGPSGIGKSTLVRRLFAARRGGGAQDPLILEGRCHPAESVPYRALDAAIDGLARHLDALPLEAVRALVPTGAHALLRLFPVLAKLPAFAGAPAPSAVPDPIELRRQGFAALRDLFAALGRGRPLVLWLDDVQWGDLDSGALLDDLRRAPAPPLLLLYTYRTDDRLESPLLRHLLSGAPERTIELGALAAGDVAALAQAILDPADPAGARGQAQIDAVVAEAAGNPFIAGEVARYVGARAARGSDRPHPRVDVAEMVRSRVDALDPDQRSLLEVAAVAGRPLDREVALAAAGLDAGRRPLVARLCDANLLRDVSGDGGSAVAAYHDCIREAVLDAVPAARRAVVHRGIAGALEARTAGDHEALSYHWEGAGELYRAGDHALLAADCAAAALAFDRAAALYAKGLDLSPDAAPRAATLEKLADALANGGRAPEAARRYLEAAGHVEGDPARAGGLLRRAAEQYLEGGYVDEGWREMRAALSLVRVKIPGSFAGALAAASWRRVVFLLGRFDARKRAFPAALPAALRPQLDALWTASTTMSMVSPHLADAFRMTHLLRVLDVGDASTVCRALAYEAAMETHLGGALLDRSVDRLLAQVAFLARRTGDPYDEAWEALALANVAFTRGAWRRTADACRRADDVLRERCHGSAWERVTVFIFHHFALAWLGDLREPVVPRGRARRGRDPARRRARPLRGPRGRADARVARGRPRRGGAARTRPTRSPARRPARSAGPRRATGGNSTRP